ncbi:MAG: RNA polymerase sigma factor [Lachnospirales bacterium]
MIILILDKKEAENINKIYTQYSKFMFAVAYNILNNVHNSEDAIQQALIKIIENINKIDDIKSKRTRNYIGLIVRNIAINMYNSGKRETMDMEDDIEAGENFEVPAIIIRKETVDRLKKYIAELDNLYKIPILMSADGYDSKEIANALGISSETARKRIERGRKKLRQAFEKEEI